MTPALAILAALALAPLPGGQGPAWTVDRIVDGHHAVLEAPAGSSWATLPAHALPAGTREGDRLYFRPLVSP